MRYLALALLVANAAFFSWRFNEDLKVKIENARPVAALAAGTPSLKLVSELDQLPPLRETAEAAPSAPPAAAPSVPEEEALSSSAPSATPSAEPAAGAVTMDAEGAATPGSADGAETSTAAVESTPVAEGQSEDAVPPTVAATSPTAPAAVPETAPPAAANAPASDALVAAGTGAPSGVCVHIGPFLHAADLAPLQRWLAPRATLLKPEITTTRKRQLFWVYLEPRTAGEAKEKLADLKRSGISDYLLIKRGGLENAISLGLFSSQDAVNRRLAEMTEKGYKPIVVPRFETTDLHWLNAEFATGYENHQDIPPELRGTAGVETTDCATLAHSAEPANPEKA